MSLKLDWPTKVLLAVASYIAVSGFGGCGCGSSSSAHQPLQDSDPGIERAHGRLPLAFELNAGQADGRYQLLAHGTGHDLYLSSSGLSAAFTDGLGADAGVIEMVLEGANSQARWEPAGALPGRMNYFIGRDPSHWRTNIPTYSRIRYKGVYPGIDVDYYGNQAQLEHDFVVAPGADPARIQLRFAGADRREIMPDGSLNVTRGGRTLRWAKPLIYQETSPGVRQPVAGSYRMVGEGVGFALAKFDSRLPLVIDPVVSYSTFLGRNANEGIFSVAVDASGNTYSAGITTSADYATTPGALVSSAAGAGTGDVLVTKLNATGSALVYSARIGGIGQDAGMSIAIDAEGNAYVAGAAESTDFPTTAGSVQTRYGGRGQGSFALGDCFLLKLNSSGSALTYSSYLGGSGSEMCRGVAIDGGGNAYVAGFTNSTNFQVTENAFQRAYRGAGEQEFFQGGDAFVAKFNSRGDTLAYSTLVGGTADDVAWAIAVDSGGSAYVTGATTSPSFPTTAGVAQRNYGGGGGLQYVAYGDGFVFKLNPAGSALTYSTFVGGRADDSGFGIALDTQGSAYVTGSTLSNDFPVSTNAYQKANRGASGTQAGPAVGDAFVLKLNPQATAFIYSTYLGGSKDDGGMAIAVDAGGAAYVGGCTTSTNFPVSADARQPAYRGESPVSDVITGDGFLARIDPSGAAVSYSTYLGGVNDDCALALAVDSSTNVYVAGNSASSDFITTPGVVQPVLAGGISGPRFPVGDGFLTKFADFGGTTASNVSISAIVSAASYAGGGVAPGEITTLTGLNIGPAALVTLAVSPANIVSSILAETRVLFDDVAAPIIYASAGQTSAIVPYEMAGRQSARVVVEYRGARSAAVVVPILAAKPGLFSANASGRGPGAIQNEDARLNTPDNPSAKGRIVILYGTGEGQTNPPGVSGALAVSVFPKPVLPVTVTIGGRTADVVYAGAAPSLVAGLFQMNVKIPEDVPSGNLDVVVTVGSARSQTGLTVAVR